VSLLVLIVPSPAVGAPRVFQSFRAGIRWGVGSPLLDISLSDDPSIVSDVSSSNDNLPLVPTEPPPSSTDTSNHKPNSSYCATSHDILWIDRYCSTRVGSVVHHPTIHLNNFASMRRCLRLLEISPPAPERPYTYILWLPHLEQKCKEEKHTKLPLFFLLPSLPSLTSTCLISKKFNSYRSYGS